MRPPAAYLADDGAAYERFLGRWTGRLAQALIDFAELPGDGPVLDVGCGTGSVAFELRRRFPDRSVSAVDVSAAYLAFARGREGGASIQFEQADALRPAVRRRSRLPGRSRSWRSTSCPTPRGRCWRCAASRAPAGWSPRRSGTFAAVSFISACSGTPLRRSIRRPRRRVIACSAHPLAQPDGLARLWQESGLREIEDGSLTIRMDYAELRRLLGAAARRPGAVRLVRRRADGCPTCRDPRRRSAPPSARAGRTARVRSPPPPGPCAGACRSAWRCRGS